MRGGLSFLELTCWRSVLRAFSFLCTEVPLCPLVEATRNRPLRPCLNLTFSFCLRVSPIQTKFLACHPPLTLSRTQAYERYSECTHRIALKTKARLGGLAMYTAVYNLPVLEASCLKHGLSQTPSNACRVCRGVFPCLFMTSESPSNLLLVMNVLLQFSVFTGPAFPLCLSPLASLCDSLCIHNSCSLNVTMLLLDEGLPTH